MKPPGMGLLVRTEAEGTDEDAIIEDLESLKKQWEAIQQQANYGRPPLLIDRDDDFIQRVLRDIYSDEVNRIVVDSATGLKRVKSQLMNWEGGKAPDGLLIDHHREKQPVLDYFRVNAAIREALKPRVDLPSGGYVVIEPTEALTVIDVNSGSFTKSATARETVLWTNFEAATEIARQLRLRNIGGVIVVDFIDMDARRDQLRLLEHFTQVLKSDKARPQIAQLSELGLVELTRKRQGKNLYELFGTPCPHCNGLGHLVHLPGDEEPVGLPVHSLSVATQSGASASDSRPTLVNRIAPVTTPRTSAKAKSSSTEDSLDLLHHPDYQEQSNNGNRRRRRRTPEVTAKPVLRDVNETEKDEEQPTDNGAATAAPVKEETTEKPATNGNGNTTRYDRRERGRYRREETKTETIQVEMTQVEQSIYALIGVSPLVKVEGGDEKDPRATIVRVVRPGEAIAVMDSSPEPEVEVEAQTPVKKVIPNPVSAKASEDKDEATEEKTTKEKPTKEKPTVKVIARLLSEEESSEDTETVKPVTVAKVEESPEEETEPEQKVVRRRRRRRSSAADD
jgi:ribonuclease E